MIENFLLDAIENIYLIFIVLSVNGSYDPRNAWLKMKIDWTWAWVSWLKCDNDFFILHFYFVDISLWSSTSTGKWSGYVTFCYYGDIDSVWMEIMKNPWPHNERWLHHMQFIETEWVQHRKKIACTAMNEWKLCDPNDVQNGTSGVHTKRWSTNIFEMRPRIWKKVSLLHCSLITISNVWSNSPKRLLFKFIMFSIWSLGCNFGGCVGFVCFFQKFC